ncbi:thiol reductant ABC exporter subunit CydD [Cohaesibacter sp. ES.047]|uniref:thiol reductant ABC exporter subunit CydD n=1 Tax=Cohaesibacter sp. ES.047 TaxID=1798205 RepID=UPI000BB7FD94|nr:thiol reductant ABC exporter subunit CydD [Cohaesibacter sp. ES.047]
MSATATTKTYLKQQSKKAKTPLNWSIALSFASGLLLIVQMGFLAHIINGVLIEGGGLSAFYVPLAILPAIFIARAALTYLSERIALHAAIDLKAQLRAELLARLLQKGPIIKRGEEASVGEQATMLTEGLEALQGYFARYLPAMVMMALLPLAILVVTLSMDWVSALVMAVTAPLIPVFMIFIGKGTEKLNQKQWRKLARLSAHFLDMIQGLTTLKLFNASRKEAETVSRMAEDYRRTTMSVLRVAFLSSLVLEFFATISIALIAVFIGFRLLYGEIDFFSGFYVLLLAPDFYAPLRNMGGHYHARMEAVGAAETMADLMQESPQTKTPASLSLPDSKAGIALEFRDVSFAYEDGSPALEGISFDLKRGESLALVGRSGAGKSTLIDLLIGFVQPTSGEILINGQSLSDLSMEAWRKQLAYVPQTPTLFSGTIREAIRYGAPGADDASVEAAGKAARVEDFVRDFADGYDHHIGEKGQGLSGGQIQRIAIARALVRAAPLVLLDEPSAHLDRESEKKLLEAMKVLNEAATTITIAHRLYTIRQADRILVLDRGHVVQNGSHEELMAEEGLYRTLVKSEFGLTIPKDAVAAGESRDD